MTKYDEDVEQHALWSRAGERSKKGEDNIQPRPCDSAPIHPTENTLKRIIAISKREKSGDNANVINKSGEG